MIAPLKPKAPRRGTTLLEGTLVISMAMLLMFGILEYGRYIMTRQLLENAARAGARYAVVNTYAKNTIDVQNEVEYALGGQQTQLEGYSKTTSIQVYRATTTGAADSTDSNWKNAAFGDLIAVRISGDYRPILPSFLLIGVNSSGTIPVQVTAIMYSEAN